MVGWLVVDRPGRIARESSAGTVASGSKGLHHALICACEYIAGSSHRATNQHWLAYNEKII